MNFLLYLLISPLFASVYSQNFDNNTHTFVDWYCADESCKEYISVATLRRRYTGNHKEKLTLSENTKVNVLRKPVDSKILLWEVEVSDKKGYVLSSFLREDSMNPNYTRNKVIVKRSIANDLLSGPPTHKLPSNVNNNGMKVDSEAFKTSSTIDPTATYDEVIEGTPIPRDNYITPHSTQEQSATVVPTTNVPNVAIEDHQSNLVTTSKINDNVKNFENSQESSNNKKVTEEINEKNIKEESVAGVEIEKSDELLDGTLENIENNKDPYFLQKKVVEPLNRENVQVTNSNERIQLSEGNSENITEPIISSTVGTDSAIQGSAQNVEGTKQAAGEENINYTEQEGTTMISGEDSSKNNSSLDEGISLNNKPEVLPEKLIEKHKEDSNPLQMTVTNSSEIKDTSSGTLNELSTEKSDSVSKSDVVTLSVEKGSTIVDSLNEVNTQEAEASKEVENSDLKIKELVAMSISVDNSSHATHVEKSESSKEKSKQNEGDSVKEDNVESSYTQYSSPEFQYNNIPEQTNSIPNPSQTYSSESQLPQSVDSKTDSVTPNTHSTESLPPIMNKPLSSLFHNPAQEIKYDVELSQKVENDNLPNVPITGQHSSQFSYDSHIQAQQQFGGIGPKEEKYSILGKGASDQVHPPTTENKEQTNEINTIPLYNNISDQLSEETKQEKELEPVINEKNVNTNEDHIGELNGDEDSLGKSTLSDSDTNILPPHPTEATLTSTEIPIESATETEPDLQLDPIITAESVPQEEESYFKYLFSSIFSAENSFLDLFKSSQLPDVKEKDAEEEVEVKTSEQQPTQPVETTSQVPTNEYCDKDICDQHLAQDVMDSVNKVAEEILSNPVESSLLGFGFIGISTETILLLIITSIVVLIFSLGHYYIENSRRDGDLVAKINSLEGELFLVKKEQTMLEENVSKANEKAESLRESIKERDNTLSELQKELEDAKGIKTTLEETVSRQEKEIETLMENGLEMHKLLSETMSEEERSQVLLANIAELKESLTERLDEIMLLTDQLDHKNQEIQLLQLDLKTSVDKQSDLENKLSNIQMDVDDQILKAVEPLKLQIIKLEELIEEKTAEQTRVETEVARLRGRCESLSMRCEVAEKGLQEAQGLKSEEALAKWEDVSSIRSNLLAAENKITSLLDDQDQLISAKNDLTEQMKNLTSELKHLNNKYEMAEKEKIEALTKLQVLSNYFKEKETQLQEELGVKESLWLQKQSEDHTIYEQMRALREENLSYKSQNELLKKEVLEQEASLKKQIANEEQKAHENWVGLRQAERRLKEVQMEAAMLRNRLTALESSSNQNLEDKLNPNGLEPNGDGPYQGAASPPFMMFPREFMPPPPLTHATPTRPPPLGRISSPPLPVDFTPPPPLFDLYSSSSPPPPPLHKPQPREGKREQKDSYVDYI